MSNPPANSYDITELVELAFKSLIFNLSNIPCHISFDQGKHSHPCCLIVARDDVPSIAPGTGIFKVPVEIRLEHKYDSTTPNLASRDRLRVRQCFYRNDNNPNPMRDLAIRLTNAIAEPFTCLGVVPTNNPAIYQDPETRIFTYAFTFDVHCAPTR